jgi:transcriptional accessory protein Tex/SPT6
MDDDHAQVEAARIPDRDRLLQELRDAGLDAHPVDEVGIEVNTTDDDLLSEVEGMITSLGAPFVPMKHEGVIYIRPPLS